MLKLKQRIRYFMCNMMGWHSPTQNIRRDGINYKSRCKHCNRKIMQDDQGNWFEY